MSQAGATYYLTARTALLAAGAAAPATIVLATALDPSALVAAVTAPGWPPYLAAMVAAAAAMVWLTAATWTHRWRATDAATCVAACVAASAIGFLYLLLALDQNPVATVVLVIAATAAAAWIAHTAHAHWKDARS